MASFFNFSSPAWARTTLHIHHIGIQGCRDIDSLQFLDECGMVLQRILPFGFLDHILHKRWRAAKYESSLWIHKADKMRRQSILFIVIFYRIVAMLLLLGNGITKVIGP